MFYVVHGNLRRHSERHLKGWQSLEPYIDQDLSPLLENMTVQQLVVLLEAMHLGNGSKQRGQSWIRRSYYIVTSRHLLAERIQSLCIRQGYRCNIAIIPGIPGVKRTLYMLHIKKGTFRAVGRSHQTDRPHLEVEKWASETIWCLENPLRTLVIRRHGKTAITGNCQMTERETRPSPNTSKTHMILLDIAEHTRRHKLITLKDLIGMRQDPENGASVVERLAREAKVPPKGNDGSDICTCTVMRSSICLPHWSRTWLPFGTGAMY